MKMKMNLKSLLFYSLLSLLSLSLVMGTFGSHASAAASATLGFEQPEHTVSMGDTVRFQVMIDPVETAVNVVDLELSYDIAMLDFIALDPAGSRFTVIAEEDVSVPGTVRTTRGSFATVSTRSKVVEVVFQVVGEANEQGAVSIQDTSLVLDAQTGQSIPTTFASTQVMTDGDVGGIVGGLDAEVEARDISIDATYEDDININWETTQPSTSVVRIGTDPENLDIVISDDGFATLHSVRVESGIIEAGVDYYYQIVSLTESGQRVLSEVASLRPPEEQLSVETGEQEIVSGSEDEDSTVLKGLLAGGGIVLVVLGVAIFVISLMRKEKPNQQATSSEGVDEQNEQAKNQTE